MTGDTKGERRGGNHNELLCVLLLYTHTHIHSQTHHVVAATTTIYHPKISIATIIVDCARMKESGKKMLIVRPW